jgi:hypothetical protein
VWFDLDDFFDLCIMRTDEKANIAPIKKLTPKRRCATQSRYSCDCEIFSERAGRTRFLTPLKSPFND